MKYYYLILFTLLTISCKNKTEISIDKKLNETQISESEVISFNKIRTFNEDLNIFLNFYKGMNVEEYRLTINKNIRSSKLYYYVTDYKLNNLNLSSLINESNIKSSKEITNSNEFLNDLPSNILYKYSINGNSYFVRLKPRFNSKKELNSINLTLPIFDNSNITQGNSNEQFKKSKTIMNQFLKLYQTKYGNPKIEEDHFKTALLRFDKNRNRETKIYKYFSNHKVISIEHNCCVFIELEIKYELLRDFNQLKKTQLQTQQQKQKTKDINNKSTMTDI